MILSRPDLSGPGRRGLSPKTIAGKGEEEESDREEKRRRFNIRANPEETVTGLARVLPIHVWRPDLYSRRADSSE